MNVYLTSTIGECMSLTAKHTKDNLGLLNKKCFVFCEDRINLNIEAEIASLQGGFFGAEVFTFKRYIKSKMPSVQMLSKEASCMVVRKIINLVGKDLKCFKASSYRPTLALTIYEIISQLESAKISASELTEMAISQDKKLSLALKNKIADISLIYSKYKEYLEENDLCDSNDYLSLMPNLVFNDNELKGAKIIITGYLSATKQRQEIFRALNNMTSDFNAVLIGDRDSDLYTNDTLLKLLEIDKNANVITSKESFCEEIKRLKKYLYNPCVFKKSFNGFSTENVSVYESVNPSSEVENVAKLISLDIRNGKRFKDIALIAGDLNAYYPFIASTFSEYDIPFYVDKAKTLQEHPISLYILNYIDLVRKGFLVDNFVKFISSSLFLVDKSVTDKFKNYIYKNALSKNNLKTPFEDDEGKEFESLREVCYSCYLEGRKSKTLNDYVLATLNMLEKTKAFENLNLLGESLKNIGELKLEEFNQKAPQKITSVLTEMQAVAGDVEVSALDFKNMFSSGTKALEIDSIPLFNDAVYVGEFKSSKIKSVKNLYAIGLNGDVPFSKSDTALLTDSDLLELDGVKMVIEPKISFVNKRERESVILSLLSFNEKLYLSYSQVGNNGEASYKSELINYFTQIFNLEVKKEKGDVDLTSLSNEEKIKYLSAYSTPRTIYKQLASSVAGYKDNEENAKITLSSFFKAVDDLNLVELKENSNKIYDYTEPKKQLNLRSEDYFYDNNVSASALEKYFNCPYSSFVQNVLKLQDNETGEIKVYETGTLLHLVVEKYVDLIDNVNGLEESNILVEKIVNEVLNSPNYVKFLNKPQYKFIFSRLEKESKRVCFAIYNSLKDSSFKPYLLEAGFGDNKKFKPIKLSAKNGEYKLHGKVDRIDKYKDNIRVIDYKTGTIDSSDESFYTGRKIQLYLYMNAFTQNGLIPSGAYYFPVHDGFEKKADRNYLMKGKTVDTKEIISATDNTLSEGSKSQHVSVAINKDGKLSKKSATLTEEEMKNYLKYAIKIAEKGVDEITSGFIEPTPYVGACTYCQYGGMCGFDLNSCAERVAKKITTQTIVNAVKNDEKEAKDEW